MVLRGKKSKEVRPSNSFLKPTEVPMLHQSTSFCWHFTDPQHEGLLIHHSLRGTFNLCRRSQVGPMCWETRTLSCHQTLEQAVAAADDHALVPC